MRRFTLIVSLVLGLVAVSAARSFADEVLFLNGDRLTGKILSATGGKLTIKTDGAGDVTVDMSKVKTFSTDEPVRVGRKGAEEEPPVTHK
jgi:hypothetical protein